MNHTADPFPLFFLIFLGLMLVVGVIWFLAWRARRRRILQMTQEAANLGLTFEEKSLENLPKTFSDLAPFRQARQGGRPRVRNVIRGRFRTREVRFLDFIYTVRTGKSSHDVVLGVAIVLLPDSWPELSIVPEHFGHKVWDAVGGEDIDFESEEFSRKYWVKATDRKFAYDVLHPRAMEHVMPAPWQRWHLSGNALCLWHDRPGRPSDVRPVLEALVAFLDLVPRFASSARHRVAVLGRPTPPDR